ncbi:MAG: transcription antitermination factor NusB [Gammaproteobacteria bacterium]|nr:transcription antitermination factor NusB [Gammaproteobacteria bacterium]
MANKKSRARHHAVQAIYQWQMTGQDIRDIREQFISEQDPKSFDIDYFEQLLRGVPTNLSQLDGELKSCLDRSIESVDPVERAILRLGAFELTMRPELPYRVVINEAVELAKIFGAEQGHRYVNGVLDKLAQRCRQGELKPR